MLDMLFALYLLMYLPATKLWSSTRKNKGDIKNSRMHGYQKTIASMTVRLLALWMISRWSGHTARALGLDMPVSVSGMWGLLFAVLLLGSLAAQALWSGRNMSERQRESALDRMRSEEMLPRTYAELSMFCFVAVCIGAGWEILYRGFLMLVLTPLVGNAIAVILSAVAYGAGHGYSNPKQFSLSIVSALVFTIAFVSSHSLWWLMLIHTGFGFLFVVISFKLFNALEFPEVATPDRADQPLR